MPPHTPTIEPHQSDPSDIDRSRNPSEGLTKDEMLRNLIPALVRLDERLQRVESSIIFKTLRAIGRLYSLGIRAVFPRETSRVLRLWRKQQSISTRELESINQRLTQIAKVPLISILVYAGPSHTGDEYAGLLRSLTDQPYQRWELLLPHGRLKSEEISSERLGVCSTLLSGASVAGQSEWPSIESAAGDLLAFMELGDTLPPETLTLVAREFLQSQPDVMYTDEASLMADGRTLRPVFKPGYSPHLLPGPSYPGRLIVVKKDSAVAAGGLKTEFGSAADYDLFLRMADSGSIIRRLPKVLYVRRTLVNRQDRNAIRALEESLRRRNENAIVVSDPESGVCQVERLPRADPRVSIIIVSTTPSLLKTCLSSIVNTTSYTNYELIVAHHECPDEHKNEDVRRLIGKFSVGSISYSGPFNYSNLNNQAASIATGDFFVFLNDDVMPLNSEWLQRLIGSLESPSVGVVGARLLYPNGSIQHAGIVRGMQGCMGHAGRHTTDTDLFPWLSMTRNVSAVTGACLAVRGEVFQKFGGFDPGFDVNFNDVDLCFRIKNAGLEVILEAGAVLTHHECQTRQPTVRLDELYRLQIIWGELLSSPDPYYSPALSLETENIQLSLKHGS